MFVKLVPDNHRERDGFYCSLVETVYVKGGSPKHTTLRSFGYVERERVPYLKAAFDQGDPDKIVAIWKKKLAIAEAEG